LPRNFFFPPKAQKKKTGGWGPVFLAWGLAPVFFWFWGGKKKRDFLGPGGFFGGGKIGPGAKRKKEKKPPGPGFFPKILGPPGGRAQGGGIFFSKRLVLGAPWGWKKGGPEFRGGRFRGGNRRKTPPPRNPVWGPAGPKENPRVFFFFVGTLGKKKNFFFPRGFFFFSRVGPPGGGLRFFLGLPPRGPDWESFFNPEFVRAWGFDVFPAIFFLCGLKGGGPKEIFLFPHGLWARKFFFWGALLFFSLGGSKQTIIFIAAGAKHQK